MAAEESDFASLAFTGIAKNADNPQYIFAASGTEKVGDKDVSVLFIIGDGIETKWWVDAQNGLVMRSAYIGAEILLRKPDGTWPKDPLSVREGDLVLDSIGFRAPLAEVYRTTRLRLG